MTDQYVEALAAQMEGLGQAFLVLGALLNQQGLLDGQLLQARIRSRAEELDSPHPVVLEQIEHLADQLLRNYLHVRGLGREEIETQIQSGKIRDD
ncbi:hypothetical protein [Pseudomonas citronellolis]|uniref:hypothetical protein n=1 Tax=Pseudomonas citronellolis TaxID=53408 RepID=UPI0023E46172|nr:hypothetical protein [Pseudomonas citronellolis]MDF3932960.1 hypothetical protein [Pseudomonas citronellolis]